MSITHPGMSQGSTGMTTNLTDLRKRHDLRIEHPIWSAENLSGIDRLVQVGQINLLLVPPYLIHSQIGEEFDITGVEGYNASYFSTSSVDFTATRNPSGLYKVVYHGRVNGINYRDPTGNSGRKAGYSELIQFTMIQSINKKLSSTVAFFNPALV
jgi:hypothetical protein